MSGPEVGSLEQRGGVGTSPPLPRGTAPTHTAGKAVDASTRRFVAGGVSVTSRNLWGGVGSSSASGGRGCLSETGSVNCRRTGEETGDRSSELSGRNRPSCRSANLGNGKFVLTEVGR